MYGRYVVSITKCKVSVLGVDSHFIIIKIKPLAQTCKMAAKRYNSSDTISRVIYGVYNSSTLHNDHDKENIILKIKIKKHWKLKYEKYTGFKAQMEKNRLIRDQFPNKNRVSIVKNPRFSWLYGLAMVP